MSSPHVFGRGKVATAFCFTVVCLSPYKQQSSGSAAFTFATADADSPQPQVTIGSLDIQANKDVTQHVEVCHRSSVYTRSPIYSLCCCDISPLHVQHTLRGVITFNVVFYRW